MTRKETKQIYEFMGATKTSIQEINKELKNIKENHLHHLDKKINYIVFTVAGSLVLGILTIAYKLICGV